MLKGVRNRSLHWTSVCSFNAHLFDISLHCREKATVREGEHSWDWNRE